MPGPPDKRCDGLGGVGNPPAKGPFKVNFLPDVTTEVWRPVTQMASDVKPDSVAERRTTIETSLYLDPAKPQRLKLSLASNVSRAKDLFHFSYSITRHTAITLPYVLTWSATRSSEFSGALKERGLSPQFELAKIGNDPISIEFTTSGPPRLVESYIELTPAGGKTTFVATVEAWAPPGGPPPRMFTIPRDP